MSQYALPLTLPAVFAEDNFIVSHCNRDAHVHITSWPNWQALLLSGPTGSGKTHLGHIWAARAQATALSCADGDFSPDRISGNALLEDIERCDERRLLHTLNYGREQKCSLLLTASLAARQLPFTLPDLTSRLLALPAVSIDAPDDEALAGCLRKQFADRQIKVSEEIITYLLPRIERSFAMAQRTVEVLDEHSFREKRSVTIPFIKQVLGVNHGE